MSAPSEPLTTIIKRAISDPGSVRPRDFASVPEWQMLAVLDALEAGGYVVLNMPPQQGATGG